MPSMIPETLRWPLRFQLHFDSEPGCRMTLRVSVGGPGCSPRNVVVGSRFGHQSWTPGNRSFLKFPVTNL